MRDAAAGKFDLVIVFDVSRFGRDGADIIESARTLKREFGVHVIDTRGSFDTRGSNRTLTNFVQAGVVEDGRLRILDQTARGRIRMAELGKPWGQSRPIGRDYDREACHWYVTERGHAIADILERYLLGEHLPELCGEYGISSRSKISQWVWHGQLAGPYVATFNIPEAGFVEKKVVVPGMPEVVSEKLLSRVKSRLKFNRTNNRVDVCSYPLTGFVRCKDCGQALTGQTSKGKVWYRHKRKSSCSLAAVAAKEIEPAVLGFLYNSFLDEPAFNDAVQREIPPASYREQLVKDRAQAAKCLKQNETKIERYVDAIGKGADVGLFLKMQFRLKSENEALTKRLEELDTEIAALPDAEQIRGAAMLTRLQLVMQYKGRDWRELPIEDIKRFLVHLFGDDARARGGGIHVQRNSKDQIVGEFKGNVEFHHIVCDGHAVSHALAIAADTMNAAMRRQYERAIKDATAASDKSLARLKPCTAMSATEHQGLYSSASRSTYSSSFVESTNMRTALAANLLKQRAVGAAVRSK